MGLWVAHRTPWTLTNKEMMGTATGKHTHTVALKNVGAWQTKCWQKNKQRKGKTGIQPQVTHTPPLPAAAMPSNPTRQESQAP